MRVSHKTIYTSVFPPGERAFTTLVPLPAQRARPSPPAPAGPRRPGRGEPEHGAHYPPPRAKLRTVNSPGHWEGALVMAQGHRRAIGTLVEPTSRYPLLVNLSDGFDSETIRDELLAQLGPLPEQPPGNEAPAGTPTTCSASTSPVAWSWRARPTTTSDESPTSSTGDHGESSDGAHRPSGSTSSCDDRLRPPSHCMGPPRRRISRRWTLSSRAALRLANHEERRNATTLSGFSADILGWGDQIMQPRINFVRNVEHRTGERLPKFLVLDHFTLETLGDRSPVQVQQWIQENHTNCTEVSIVWSRANQLKNHLQTSVGISLDHAFMVGLIKVAPGSPV